MAVPAPAPEPAVVVPSVYSAGAGYYGGYYPTAYSAYPSAYSAYPYAYSAYYR